MRKMFLGLSQGEIVNCVEEGSGRRLTARVVELGATTAKLRCSDGTFMDLGEMSDVSRKGHTITFHG